MKLYNLAKNKVNGNVEILWMSQIFGESQKFEKGKQTHTAQSASFTFIL